jgi:hypothetical protein
VPGLLCGAGLSWFAEQGGRTARQTNGGHFFPDAEQADGSYSTHWQAAAAWWRVPQRLHGAGQDEEE